MKCMKPLHGASVCPECGYDPSTDELSPVQLRPGTLLRDNRYLLGKALGQGGFGITYIARDLILDTRAAIKEFFPNGYAVRNTAATAHVTLTDKEKSEYIMKGKEKFLQEARSLARFGDVPGIVKVRDFFEENSTAYIVMDYLDGIDLRGRIKTESFKADELFLLMDPLFDALKKIHDSGLIHRDISPDNIMMRKDGSLVLMDFGAARIANYEDQHSMSVLLKSGYAPIEQYSTQGQQGPWTDIYALCATIYKCITGETPPNSLQRRADFMTGSGDPLKMPSEMGIEITPQQENMLRQGLSIMLRDRPKNITELRELLNQEITDSQGPGPKPLRVKPAKLFAVYNHSDWEFDLIGEQTLGRKSSDSTPDLNIEVRSVSRKHGRFSSDRKNRKYLYTPDENSTNGTRLNGAPLTPGEEIELECGDILTIHPQKQSRQSDVVMIFTTSYAENTEWRYIGISRDSQEIVLGMQAFSRMGTGSFDVKYASLFFTGGDCVVIDQGKNDIFVNNRKIDQVQYLEPMDVISVRGYYLLYTGQSLMYQTEKDAPYLSQITNRTVQYPSREKSFFSVRVEERDIWKRFRKNTVFRNYRIRVNPGSLVLIMGGSDILEGIINETDLNEEASSLIRIPENPELERSYRKMKNGIAYVSRTDDLPADVRVYDLIAQTLFRSGLAEKNTEACRSRVFEILHFFHLDGCGDLTAGQLKYSQRRILNIAVQYAKDPELMYVDYPDSGLDRRAAGLIIQLLKRIAARGKIVLVTSNRPDAEAALYDLIIVLGQNPQTGERLLEFAGTQTDALRFFRTRNLEDILQRVYAKYSRR